MGAICCTIFHSYKFYSELWALLDNQGNQAALMVADSSRDLSSKYGHGSRRLQKQVHKLMAKTYWHLL